MKKLITLSLVSLCILFAQAQDLQSYTRIVKKLSSAKYQGRGYAQNGVVKAGNYLAQEFQKASADTVFQQTFTQDINTYPGNMTMHVDNRKLSAGEDFVMREYSPGAHGTFKLYFVDTLHYDIERIIADLNKPENKDAMVVCDFWFPYKHGGDFRRLEGSETGNAGFIYTWTTPLKFYKAYGQRVVEKPVIWTTAAAMEGAKNVTLDIDHQFMADYESSNIVARVQGRRHDSCFVFTAHYDHLGNLGRDIYCPGVNDNATYTCNIQDGATDIPSGDFYLVITFSKPIDVESFELFWGDSHCTGEFPTLARGTDIIHWNESQTVCSFALDLKPHTKYSFAIYGDRYKTMDGHTAGDRSYINFTTGD